MAAIHYGHLNLINTTRGGCCSPDNPECNCEIIRVATPANPGNPAYFDLVITTSGCSLPVTIRVYDLSLPSGFPPVLQVTALVPGPFTAGTLPGGDYKIVVTDAKGCDDELYASLPLEPLALTITCSNPSTAFASDGTASVVATGGVAPYTYLWSNGATTPAISGLPITVGGYSVTVTDAVGNVATGTAACSFDVRTVLDFCLCIDNTINLLVANRTLTVSAVTNHPAPFGFEYSLDGVTWQTSNTFTITNAMVAPGGTYQTVYVRPINFPASVTIKSIYISKGPFVFNNALHLDGVNDCVTTDALNGTAIPKFGTVVVWFKPGETPDINDHYEGMDTGAGGSCGVLWSGVTNSNFNLHYNVGWVQARIGGLVLSKTIKPPYIDGDFRGGWIFVAMTWETVGTNYLVKLYVGDSPSATWLAPVSGTATTSALNWTNFIWGARGTFTTIAGQWPYSYVPFNFYGFLDDARYFNRALKECELRCLFNDGKGNSILDVDPNQRVYYKFDETKENTATNSGVGGGALNGLLRGFSGADGNTTDFEWRTEAATNEAWRPHAATPIGVEYPVINFLQLHETISTTYNVNPGDSFSIFIELELLDPVPAQTPLTPALCGVFRPSNSRLHGQSPSALEDCATPEFIWDMGIFDARLDVNPLSADFGKLIVNIADRNDFNHTAIKVALPKYENHRAALAFVVDGVAETIRCFWDAGIGGGSVELFNEAFSTTVPANGELWNYSGMYGGTFLMGTPCPFVTDYPGGPCGAEGLISQAHKLFDLHITDAVLTQVDFDNWFNEAVGIDPVTHVRNERTVLAGANARRWRCVSDPAFPTRLTETSGANQHGELYYAINSFYVLTPIGPPTNICFYPLNYTATFDPTPANFTHGWLTGRHLANGTGFLIN